jgi:signal transduction histidine kinase
VTAALGVSELGAGIGLHFAAREQHQPVVGIAVMLVTLVGIGVGLLVTVRRPDTRVAWLLAGNGLLLGGAVLLDGLASYLVLGRPHPLAGGRVTAVLSNADWPLLFAGLVAVAFTFPDGQLPAPRWRWHARLGVVAFVLVLAGTVLSTDRLDEPFQAVEPLRSGAPSAVVGTAAFVAFLGMFATLVNAVRIVRYRLRRASGVQRQQLLWLAWGSLTIPLAVLVCVIDGLLTGRAGDVTLVAVCLAQAAVPVCVAIAVLRHGLWDIERLVSRSLTYLVLTVVLAVAYAGVAVPVGVALGRGSAWATAGGTLAAASAFRPLRSRVQSWVDRRFAPARVRGVRRVEAFVDAVRQGREAPEDIGRALSEALNDPTLTVLFWLPESAEYADAQGRRAAPPEGEGVCVPVERGGSRLGLVVHDAGLQDETGLVADVLIAAGLAIEIARLRVEVRRQLAEVAASRQRIVAAGDAERRRLERDLHDGAQQRLVSLGLALRHVQHELPAESDIRATLDSAVDELGSTIGELRALASGIRPPRLDEGLAAALSDLARNTPLPVDVDVCLDRLPGAVETAAYFVACEALTNAVKHAGASRIAVRIWRADGQLRLLVEDDGIGGATAGDGTGLAGLADRIDAEGGHLQVDSPEGAGTRVHAELPCGS